MTDRYETARTQWANDVRDIATSVAFAYQDARQLLVGGTWLPGPFRFIDGAWLNTAGVVVTDENVQARELDGDARASWDRILDLEPAPDCETSGYDIDRGDPQEPITQGGTHYWCHIHESEVPIVAAGGVERVAQHDNRGRLLD